MVVYDVRLLPDLPGPALACRSGSSSRSFVSGDYERYMGGVPRDDGTRSFLASRSLPRW